MTVWREIVAGIRTLASAGAYALLIGTFGFQVARVDGLSMQPTLQDHDRLFVSRLRYPVRDDYVSDDFRSHDDWGPEVVQEGYYLVMGDHRNVSSDSRDWGQVPKKYIVGRVNARWWPLWDLRLF
jgi:signal peptidase I